MMTQKDINEIITEGIGETEGTVIDGIDYMLEESLGDLFNMNTWDEPEEGFSKVIKFKDKKYRIDIQEDGCVEATNEHRIMDWTHTITEL